MGHFRTFPFCLLVLFLMNQRASSERPYKFLELFAAVLHILEEVEAGAAWAEQYGVTGLCQFVASLDTVLH